MDANIEQIKESIQMKISPVLAGHGGAIDFDGFEDGVVWVKLKGACSGCPGVVFTMREVIEEALLDIPGVKEVKLRESVSEEMIDFAKKILSKNT